MKPIIIAAVILWGVWGACDLIWNLALRTGCK
jgi:hypothetical protein